MVLVETAKEGLFPCWGLVYVCTVRWSNFERLLGRKVGIFLKSTEATPCEHFSKSKPIPLKTPCPCLPWPWFSHENSLKIFEVLWKIWNFEIHFKKKSISCRKMGLKSSKWFCLKVCFYGYSKSCFTHFLFRRSTSWAEAQQSHEQAPRNAQMTWKVQSFVSKFEVLFVGLPEDVWPSNFGECLNMLLLPKIFFFFYPGNFELCAKLRGVQSKPCWRYLLPFSFNYLSQTDELRSTLALVFSI